jgi:anti-sigma factor RsiW
MSPRPPIEENAELLARAAARTPECPPVDRLAEALLGELPSAERAAILAHVDGCPACGAEAALARSFGAERVDGDEESDVARIEARLAGTAASESTAAAPARVLAWRPKRAHAGPAGAARWARWASAALVLVAVGLAYRATRGPSLPDLPPPGPDDVVRAAAVEPVAPVGEIPGVPGQLEWRAVAGAASYRVELLDVADESIWTATAPAAAAPRVELPEAARFALRPRASYAWRVTALDADGSELARSERIEFAVAAGP